MHGTPRLEAWERKRFWSLVKRRRSGCWVWRGPHDGSGYARFALGDRTHAAHRIAYALRHEDLLGRLRHTCGNKGCVNPRHLYEERADQSWIPRFHSMVTRRGPSECWEWTGARNAGGYGVLHVEGGTRYAHHLAWQIARLPYSGGRLTHTCGNRGCVNPDHLDDRDPDNAGKLGEDEVAQIRAICLTGIEQSRVAAHFRISPSMVSRIVHGTRWRWV